MRHRSKSKVPAILREDWRRWTDIVELFAHGRSARRRIDPQAYGTIYRRLIKTCEEISESSEGSGRDYYEGLGDMVRPWISPSVFAHADREILHLLLARCRQVERKFGGRRLPILELPGLPVLVLPGLVVLSLIGWLARELGAPLYAGLVRWSYFAWFTVRRSSELDRLFAVNVILVITSIYVLTRTSRS